MTLDVRRRISICPNNSTNHTQNKTSYTHSKYPQNSNTARTVQVVNAHDTQTKTCSRCSAGQWDCRRFYRQCLQIQLNQEISRIHFLNSGRFLRDKPYNIKMQVKFVMFEDLLFLSFSWHLPGRDANPSDPSDQGLKKLWNFEARACISLQKNLDFINKNVTLD